MFSSPTDVAHHHMQLAYSHILDFQDKGARVLPLATDHIQHAEQLDPNATITYDNKPVTINRLKAMARFFEAFSLMRVGPERAHVEVLCARDRFAAKLSGLPRTIGALG